METFTEPAGVWTDSCLQEKPTESAMIEDVKAKVKELLESSAIDGFVGLAERNGHVAPHLFRQPDELELLSLGDREQAGDARYPLNKLLINLACAYPDSTFGVLVRGCDERGLKTLYTWNQLHRDKVVPVGIACPQDLADRCECAQPFPDNPVAGEKAKPHEFGSVDTVEEMNTPERFAYWMQEFEKCIKCYGCRDVCPMCFCKECTLENDELVKTGTIPPENPVFHLTRAVHMAGRCIDCGLCEEACPADIPLRTLYKKVFEIVDEEFDYRTGFTTDRKSPLNIID